MNQEIADNSRACCNCANATMSYPNCSCWQHKDCNGDKPYIIPKEVWIKTAEECEEFEMGTCQEADVYLELHQIMSEESKDKNQKPMKYIPADKLIAEIERLKEDTSIGICEYDKGEENGRFEVLNHLLSTITSLQQEPRFPQYDNIVEKIFGAGNLEGWEFREAEMLVALAKEELLKSLQQKQLVNKELGTLITCDIIEMTVKKAIDNPQDKEKEEELMTRKINYLRSLEENYVQQEQPEVDNQ